MAMREITLALEPLSEAAFAPLGHLVGGPDRPADFEADHLWNWRVPFEADGTTQVLLIRYKFVAPNFSVMERHFHVTQGFIALGDMPSAMVVAPPTDPDDPGAIPPPEALRAFTLTGEAGVILHRGTWHALQRFPLRPPHVDVAFLTDTATQADIEESGTAGTPPRRTQMHDYLDDSIGFRIEGI